MMDQIEKHDMVQTIAEICEQYGVVTLYLFGSQAKLVWEQVTTGKPISLLAGHDVDVGVRSRPSHNLSTKGKVNLAQVLEEVFGAPRVDLVCLEEADPFLAANIIRGERLYAADAYAADEYELYVLRRAGDLAPFERSRLDMILEG
jgi:predicted nucleotidyltransferase